MKTQITVIVEHNEADTKEIRKSVKYAILDNEKKRKILKLKLEGVKNDI